MLNNEEFEVEPDDDGDIDAFNLIDQLKELNLDDNEISNEKIDHNEVKSIAEATTGVLDVNNPVFDKERLSSKIKTVLDVLRNNVLSTNDKAIIVSQWTSLLKLIGFHLNKEAVPFEQLDGSVPVIKRMSMVENFNDPNHNTKVNVII